MNADFAELARFTVLIGAYLGLIAVCLWLFRRVVKWVRDVGRLRERRVARGVLAFLVMHGLTITFGGFSFILVLVGLAGRLSAGELAEMRRAMWFCFAVGPSLSLVAGIGLHFVQRTLAPV